MNEPSQTDRVHLNDALKRDWVDISTEMWRRYVFEGGTELRIDQPLRLLVSESGGHRVFSGVDGGKCFYVSPKWVAIEWKASEGKPHFVK
jgi:hypothetical protein